MINELTSRKVTPPLPARLARKAQLIQRMMLVALTGTLCIALSGCLAVGYSSGGGWFIWPGGLGLLVIVLLVLFLMRRRGKRLRGTGWVENRTKWSYSKKADEFA